MTRKGGSVAAGHDKTAEAAAIILQADGTAFDAVLAALCASCVAEPVLSSLGGGGFLLAQPARGKAVLYDFFVQTPSGKTPSTSVDFYPILADFGDVQQEFHIGMGSIATPGIIRGLFQAHRDLCKLPLSTIMEPAREFARQGVGVNALQHYISRIVEPILRASPQSLALLQSDPSSDSLANQGDLLTNPALADTFESLQREGADLFYLGEMGQRLVKDCVDHGGHLRQNDLKNYQTIKRTPLRFSYRSAQLVTNPAPAFGGMLIAFTLALLEQHSSGFKAFGDLEHIQPLARAMRLTQQLRSQEDLSQLHTNGMERLLAEQNLTDYHALMRYQPRFSRGTTQISVCDAAGNLASMTLSNGEGAGYVIPDTGIMMNNMLGEEDINPHGFHRWPEDHRIASMMAPTLIFTQDGARYATGSGGSNRIRSAILQVLLNLIDFDMDVESAVTCPRIHYESGLLHLEPERRKELLVGLAEEFPKQKYWTEQNLFFGGAHTVKRDRNSKFYGAGDPRRGGVCRIIAWSVQV